MSFSLKLLNGDLDLSSNKMGTVQGVAKLTQDLSVWLREEYGIDRFHPDYGSALDTYIGEPLDEVLEHDIQVEILRVLGNYQQIQSVSFQKSPSKYTLDELLDQVVSVECTANYDSVYVTVNFTTAQGTPGQVAGRITL